MRGSPALRRTGCDRRGDHRKPNRAVGRRRRRLAGDVPRGRPADVPFRYRHQGSLATIGRKSAVADFGWIKLHGAIAWWLWRAVHVGVLAGFRNRTTVIINRMWSHVTQRAGIRLITMSGRDGMG